MRILIQSFLILILTTTSCEKTKNCSDQLPDCINEILQNASKSKDIKTIKVQSVKEECHYWLNTGAMNYDLVEYIVDSKCDTVCFYCGECEPPECSDDHPFDKWETIWPQ
jgi:hypothetical protein